MIDCIFTIDYEIYGNGEGSLKELVYEPAERLMTTFMKKDARFVVFVEVAELEMIERYGTDQHIDLVKQQIRDFYKEGFEIGLHLHPQWYNAKHENDKWLLDYSEYNLCTLPKERIVQIVDRGIAYLREVLGVSDFTPLSFRAGNWLFQPTETVATVLAERGIEIDSSVFKGGLQRNHRLDYRPALKNGSYWRFQSDVNTACSNGMLTEIPIYTTMAPFWNMLTGKRLNIQRKSATKSQSKVKRLNRLLDYLRFSYPLKFDFCRMTLGELKSVVARVIREEQADPQSYQPMVAIGHTKDLFDFDNVEAFLSFLNESGITISTFEKARRHL